MHWPKLQTSEPAQGQGVQSHSSHSYTVTHQTLLEEHSLLMNFFPFCNREEETGPCPLQAGQCLLKSTPCVNYHCGHHRTNCQVAFSATLNFHNKLRCAVCRTLFKSPCPLKKSSLRHHMVTCADKRNAQICGHKSLSTHQRAAQMQFHQEWRAVELHCSVRREKDALHEPDSPNTPAQHHGESCNKHHPSFS